MKRNLVILMAALATVSGSVFAADTPKKYSFGDRLGSAAKQIDPSEVYSKGGWGNGWMPGLSEREYKKYAADADFSKISAEDLKAAVLLNNPKKDGGALYTDEDYSAEKLNATREALTAQLKVMNDPKTGTPWYKRHISGKGARAATDAGRLANLGLAGYDIYNANDRLGALIARLVGMDGLYNSDTTGARWGRRLSRAAQAALVELLLARLTGSQSAFEAPYRAYQGATDDKMVNDYLRNNPKAQVGKGAVATPTATTTTGAE